VLQQRLPQDLARDEGADRDCGDERRLPHVRDHGVADEPEGGDGPGEVDDHERLA